MKHCYLDISAKTKLILNWQKEFLGELSAIYRDVSAKMLESILDIFHLLNLRYICNFYKIIIYKIATFYYLSHR